MKFQYNDGGRAAAGYKGHTGDCVTRSIAIASGLPYQQVYDRLADGNATQRIGKRDKYLMKKGKISAGATGKKTAAHGIDVRRKWFKDYMQEIGFEWVSTMGIGTGCKVHLVDGELPMGRLVVVVSKHYTAVIDGVIHDTHDSQREVYVTYGDGRSEIQRRCVYGYWKNCKI
jgi:hypothetical protein